MANEIVVSTGAEMFMPVMDVKQAVARRGALVGFVQGIMIKGADYGAVPGTDKPTLLKPGAEKLTTFFGLAPVFVSERIVEEFGDDGREPLFFYRYRCELYRMGTLVGSGIGSCNSRESKYRYRNGQRVCPECQKAAIARSKYPPRNQPNAEPGWYCNGKGGGCGAQFDATDRRITDQIVGKVPNPDIADLVNTIDKMAQKRALIAAVLIAVNASEFFTQDVEDMVIDAEYTVAPQNGRKEAPPQSTPPAATVTTTGNGGAGNGRKTNGNGAPGAFGNVQTTRWPDANAAYAWAIEAGACENTHEARGSLKKIVDAQFGGRLTGDNMAAAFDAFHARQMEKLHEKAEAAVKDAPELNPDSEPLEVPA